MYKVSKLGKDFDYTSESSKKQLRDIVDKTTYEKICKNFGGQRIWIPKNGNLGHHNRYYFLQRNSMIKMLRKQGKTVEELARIYKISKKRIYNIICTKSKIDKMKIY